MEKTKEKKGEVAIRQEAARGKREKEKRGNGMGKENLRREARRVRKGRGGKEVEGDNQVRRDL